MSKIDKSKLSQRRGGVSNPFRQMQFGPLAEFATPRQEKAAENPAPKTKPDVAASSEKIPEKPAAGPEKTSPVPAASSGDVAVGTVITFEREAAEGWEPVSAEEAPAAVKADEPAAEKKRTRSDRKKDDVPDEFRELESFRVEYAKWAEKAGNVPVKDMIRKNFLITPESDRKLALMKDLYDIAYHNVINMLIEVHASGEESSFYRDFVTWKYKSQKTGAKQTPKSEYVTKCFLVRRENDEALKSVKTRYGFNYHNVLNMLLDLYLPDIAK